ncbi:MAG TPA: tetratricopeptide repeat protein [Polyangiaceae bacterium]
MKRQGGTAATLEEVLRRHRGGDREGARALCQQLVRRSPSDANGLYLLGTMEMENGQVDAAVQCLERAVKLTSGRAPFHCNLGLAYAKQGSWEKARRELAKALELDSNLAEASFNLGLVELDDGHPARAIPYLERAVRLRDSSAAIHRALGRARVRIGQLDGAVEALSRARSLEPRHAGTHRELGLCLLKLGCLEAGIDALERALELDRKDLITLSRLVFHASFSPRYSAARILGIARSFNEVQARSGVDAPARYTNDRSPERRLRVGYVSPEFRDHVQRLFTVPLFRAHDRERVEIICYSSARPEDEWTARLRELADDWRDVAGLDDSALAERVRADGIDVLVDLTMHMRGHRLGLFAAKPAPVQIAWLAYPGTTGIDGMDYRVTDPHLDPPGSPLPYSEQTLRLPNTFWCFDPGSEAPEVHALPALASGCVTFGCLNNFLKVNAGVLELWARVLNRVENSRLLLLAPSQRARDFALEALSAHGIDPARLDFVGLQWRADYLKTYGRIDIALDCVPYNGHTTSLDAFWMGVPVVTLVGDTVVGRAGLSQARNLGLPELIAESAEEFVDKAARLASDLPRLAQLRSELRARLRSSPLMDTERFACHLEAVYRDAWRRWCARPSVSTG